jgi:triosephosphate isomerase (TIM)
MKKITHPLIVGNWKMNPQSAHLATQLALNIKKGLVRAQDVEVVVAPPSLYLPAIANLGNGKNPYLLGAQDAHWEKLGAHTGEISLPMLKSIGVKYVIVGHSERRIEGETDDMVNKKVLSIIKEEAVAILCVGERERDHAGHYLGFIEAQIRSACAGLSKSKLGSLVIAYEPVWAIGTGDTATPENVHEMKIFIEKVLSDLYGRTYAGKVRILYGGSVTPKNSAVLMTEGMIDGFLVGGASLRASEFCEIVKLTKRPV